MLRSRARSPFRPVERRVLDGHWASVTFGCPPHWDGRERAGAQANRVRALKAMDASSSVSGFTVDSTHPPHTHTLLQVCIQKKKRRDRLTPSPFCFLSAQWPMLLELVGVDTRVSGNRGFLEAELWETAAWGSRSSSESSGGADRGALHSLPGAPGRRAGPAATRPEVVRAGGEGALWPADAASSPPRWAWCRPRPPRAPRPDLPNVDCIRGKGTATLERLNKA